MEILASALPYAKSLSFFAGRSPSYCQAPAAASGPPPEPLLAELAAGSARHLRSLHWETFAFAHQEVLAAIVSGAAGQLEEFKVLGGSLNLSHAPTLRALAACMRLGSLALTPCEPGECTRCCEIRVNGRS